MKSDCFIITLWDYLANRAWNLVAARHDSSLEAQSETADATSIEKGVRNVGIYFAFVMPLRTTQPGARPKWGRGTPHRQGFSARSSETNRSWLYSARLPRH